MEMPSKRRINRSSSVIDSIGIRDLSIVCAHITVPCRFRSKSLSHTSDYYVYPKKDQEQYSDIKPNIAEQFQMEEKTDLIDANVTNQNTANDSI